MRIFCQAQGNRIIMNTQAINRGEFPNIKSASSSDFFWFEDKQPEHIATQIMNLVKERLAGFLGIKPSAI